MAGATAGAHAQWMPHIAEIVQHLGLHIAYLGVIQGDTGYAYPVFPQAAPNGGLWTFALRDTLTGWLCDHAGGATGLTDLDRDPRFASSVAHVRSGGVCAFAGVPFTIAGRRGFMCLNGFYQRTPFTAEELGVVEQIASDLRLLFQTQLIELASFERGPVKDAAEEERLRIELAAAVQRDEMLLHYQPYWDLRESRVNGLEALVRWNSPVRGLVPPADCIPLAERTGLIRRIGGQVRRKAFAWAVTGMHGMHGMDIGVNVSPT